MLKTFFSNSDGDPVSLGEIYDQVGIHPDYLKKVLSDKQPTSEQTLKKLSEVLKIPEWRVLKQITEIRHDRRDIN